MRRAVHEVWTKPSAENLTTLHYGRPRGCPRFGRLCDVRQSDAEPGSRFALTPSADASPHWHVPLTPTGGSGAGGVQQSWHPKPLHVVPFVRQQYVLPPALPPQIVGAQQSVLSVQTLYVLAV